MLRIRLLRTGKKNASSFRIVLTEKTAPPRGKFLEVLGHYNPRLKEVGLKKERILYWLSQGAQASDTVHNLLVTQDIIKGPKIKKKIKAKRKAKTKEVKKEEGEGKEEKPKTAEETKEIEKKVEDKAEEKTEEKKEE
jgi:small subunit ribosomal protein S16